MAETAADHATLPWAVDWFLNRTNAGDIESVLATLNSDATITHAGEEIRNEIISEFISSPWFIAGYINLRLTSWKQIDDRWRVLVDMVGRYEDLEAAAGPFILDFGLDSSGKIARLVVTKHLQRA